MPVLRLAMEGAAEQLIRDELCRLAQVIAGVGQMLSFLVPDWCPSPSAPTRPDSPSRGASTEPGVPSGPPPTKPHDPPAIPRVLPPPPGQNAGIWLAGVGPIANCGFLRARRGWRPAGRRPRNPTIPRHPPRPPASAMRAEKPRRPLLPPKTATTPLPRPAGFRLWPIANSQLPGPQANCQLRVPPGRCRSGIIRDWSRRRSPS
jgi:hypothetical protein